MKRAERRKVWLEAGRKTPFERLPGSLKPFHRIRALTEAVISARQRVAEIVELHKPSLVSKLFGLNKTPTPEQAKNFLDAQEAVVRTVDALEAYRSRGHGRGKLSPRFGNKPGEYTPHQGKRECERRAAWARIK